MTARAWQKMLSGRRLDLLDPTPLDIEIEDIAHGLSFVARWNGQTSGNYAYSVAEHSLLVEQLYTRMTRQPDPKWQLAALLHDAPEYVIGDMISPVKSAVGPGYDELDKRLTAAIHLRFGLPAMIPAQIKRQIKKADRISAWIEATRIAGFTIVEANKFFGKPDTSLISDLDIVLRPPMQVRAGFTARHHALLNLFDMIHIRNAGPLDTPAMADLLNAIIAQGGTTAHTKPVTRSDLMDFMQAYSGRSAWLLAEDDSGALLGFQLIEPHDKLPPEACDIGTFTALGRTKMGIGTALFDRTCNRARALGFQWINATIRADNAGGLAYYQSRGFEDYKLDRGVVLDDGTIVDKISKRYAL